MPDAHQHQLRQGRPQAVALVLQRLPFLLSSLQPRPQGRQLSLGLRQRLLRCCVGLRGAGAR
jgi:hypothetical protein